MDVLWMQRTAEHLHAISRRLEAIENRMTSDVAVQATPELAPTVLPPDPAVEVAAAVPLPEPVAVEPATVQPATVQPDTEHVASQETVEGDTTLELETW